MTTILVTLFVLLLLQVKLCYGFEYSTRSSWGSSSANEGIPQPCHISHYDERVSWRDVRRLCGEGVLRIGCRLISEESIYSYDLDLERLDEGTKDVMSLFASTNDDMVRFGTVADQVACDSTEHDFCWKVDSDGIQEGGLCSGERVGDELGAERVIFSGDSARQLRWLRRLQGEDENSPTVFVSESPSLSPSQTPSESPSKTPSRMPTNAPSDAPSDAPIIHPTAAPSDSPSKSPSKTPSETPSAVPSNAPSMVPSTTPTLPQPSTTPSKSPSKSPSKTPSASPTHMPTDAPTNSPSSAPSKSPSRSPSKTPSGSPSETPSKTPSRSPSKTPSKTPSRSPSKTPSRSPSQTPSESPSETPSKTPSRSPSKTPSWSPSLSPSKSPSKTPSRTPSRSPSRTPSGSPSKTPSKSPSRTPSRTPSRSPSRTPSGSPSKTPSKSPSRTPSRTPSRSPSRTPSGSPSKTPSKSPSRTPSRTPSRSPSRTPSGSPSKTPSKSPSRTPSRTPSGSPSKTPSKSPSKSPSKTPSRSPSRSPSKTPSRSPSKTPSQTPSRSPSQTPSQTPSRTPSRAPSRTPSQTPSRSPSKTPSKTPSRSPSKSPSKTPSKSPSKSPSKTPSRSPSRTPSQTPSRSPSKTPSRSPSKTPSGSPSKTPSGAPSRTPSRTPSGSPSRTPSGSPSRTPSRTPSRSPSQTPSQTPSRTPSKTPSRTPSRTPSKSPSRTPSKTPSKTPSRTPSRTPSKTPSKSPSRTPSKSPSKSPSKTPSGSPSKTPSRAPSRTPSRSPSRTPSRSPSKTPSKSPSRAPSRTPSKTPSKSPSKTPSKSPSRTPSRTPSQSPSRTPSKTPSKSPSKTPSRSPSRTPSQTPSRSPSKTPSRSPSRTPSQTPSRSPSKTPSFSPTTSKPTTSPTTSPSNSPTVSPTVSPTRSPTETVLQVVPPIVEDTAVAEVLSTTSIPFTNIYTLAARLDICEDSKGFLISKQPIEGVIFEEERQQRTLDVDVLVPFEMMGIEPSLSPPIVITGCVHLIAIMQNQIVFNETVTIELTTATRCKAGTWTPTGTNTPDLCEPCPLGTYGESLVGSSICLECPEDRPRTEAIGAETLAECKKCPIGMYCPVDSEPVLCPRSGFYEGPGDDLRDRTANDCVKTKPCLNGWWCGEGAAEGSTYVQDLQSELVAVTSVIRQRKNGGWILENLYLSDNLVVRPKVDESTWFEFTEFTISTASQIETVVTVDSAFFGEDVDKVNTTVIVEWYRELDPGNVFEYQVSVAITIVGIIVTPLTFETSILQETNELSPSIPTQIEIYNTLCNNSVSATVSPLDCFDETYPDWFNLTEINPFDPKLIAPQNGLPLTIPFTLTNSPGLNSSRGIEDSIGKEAPFLKLCVPLELNLNGLGITVLEKSTPAIANSTEKQCPPGSFSISGTDERGCSLCSQNTYQNVPGSTFCETCPVNRPKTRFDGATDLADCLTDKGGFLTLNNTREACPAGALCEDIGITVETLKLLPGRWRTNPRSTKLWECPRSHYCRGGWMVQPEIANNESSALFRRGLQEDEEALADNVCLTNHTGPFCFQCVPGTVKRSALRVCQGCTDEDYESDRSRIAIIFFILSFIFFLIIMATYVFTYRSHLLTLGKAKKRLIEDRARDIYRALDFSTPIQITISFIQVVSGMSVTFRDVLPTFFVELRQIFSFLAFDLIAIIDFGCTLSAQNHFTSLLVSTLLPFGVSVLLFVLHVMIEHRFAKTDRALRQLLRTTTFTSFLIINFLVYPSCSSTILATFSCRTLDDGRSVITTDPSISCQDGAYEQFRAYASFMVAVYPAGIPCLYAFLLFRERRQLNPYAGENKRFGRVAKAMRKNNKSIQYVHFLWGPYKPDYFWFELFELARKLAQTSIVVFISPGSSAQVVFQLMTTVICIVVVNSARPYAERLNNYLALLSQWSLFGIALATLLIRFNKLPSASSLGQQVFEQIGTEYDQNALDAFMVILFFCVPVAAVVLVLFKSFRALRIILFCIDWDRIGKKFAKNTKPVSDLKKRISTRVKSARFSIRRASTSKPDDDGGGEGNITVDQRAAESDNPVFVTTDLEKNTPNPLFKLKDDDDAEEDDGNKKAKKKSGADQQTGDEEEGGGKPPLTKPPSLMNMVRRTGQLLNQSRASFNMGEAGSFFNKRPTNLEQALPPSKTKQLHRGSLVQLMEKIPANHEEAKDLIQKLKVHFELIKEDLLADLQQERTKKAMLISECDELDDEKEALEMELDISKEDDLPDVRPLGAAGDIEHDPQGAARLDNTASNRRLGITIDVISEVDSELEGSTGGSARPLSFRIKGESFKGSQNSIKRLDEHEIKQDYSSPAGSKRIVTFSPEIGPGGSLRSESSGFTQDSSDHELDEESYQEEKKRKLMGRRTLLRKLKQQTLEAEAAAKAAAAQEGGEGELPPTAVNRQSFRSIRALARKKLEMQKKAEEEAAAEGKPIEHAVLKSLPSFRAALSSRPVSSDEEDGEAEEKAVTPRAAPPLGQMNFSDKVPQPLSSVLQAVSHLSQQAGMDGYSSSNRSLLQEGSLRSSSPLVSSSGRNLKVEASPGGRPAPLMTALSGKFRLGGSDNDSPSGVGARPNSGRFHRGSLDGARIHRGSLDEKSDGTNSPSTGRVRSMRQAVGRILGTGEQPARPDIEEEVISIGASKDDRIRIQSNRKDGTFDVKMSYEEAGPEGAAPVADESAQVSASPKKPTPLITAFTTKFRLGGASDNDSPSSTPNNSSRLHRGSLDESSATNSPSANRVKSMRQVVGRIGGKVLGNPEQSPKPDIEEEVISIGSTKDDRIRIQSNRKDGTFDVKMSYEEVGPEGGSQGPSAEPSAGPKKPTPLITAFSQKFRLGGSDNDSPSGAPRPSSGKWRRGSLDETRTDGTSSPSTTTRVRSMRQAVGRIGGMVLGTPDQSPKPDVEEEVIPIGATKDDRIRIQSNRKDGTFDVKMSYEELGPDTGSSSPNEPSQVSASPKMPSPPVAGLSNKFKLTSSDNDNSPRGLASSLSSRWNRGSIDSQTSKPGGSSSPVVRKDHDRSGRPRLGESGEGSPLTRAQSVRQIVGRIGSKVLGAEQPTKKEVDEEVISLGTNTDERIRIKSNKRDGTFEAGFGAKSGDLDESEYISD